jgi:hypothetical protein
MRRFSNHLRPSRKRCGGARCRRLCRDRCRRTTHA